MSCRVGAPDSRYSRIAARALAQRLNEDHSDRLGSTTAGTCGQAARYAGGRLKTFTKGARAADPGTRLLPLQRLPYRQLSGDQALGLVASSLSPGAARNVGTHGGRGQLRQDERVADGLGRGVRRDPPSRALRRPAGARGRRRRARRTRADRTLARAHDVTAGWTVPACPCASSARRDGAASTPRAAGSSSATAPLDLLQRHRLGPD